MRFAVLPAFAFVLAAQTPDSQVVFEAASVRHGVPGDYHASFIGGPGSNDPARISVENYPLSSLVEMAYDIRAYQLAGPGWLEEERFTITAKLPEGTSTEQLKLMVRNLLIERFRLAGHFERRQVAGYRLVVAKSGPKLALRLEDGNQAKSDPVKPDAPFKPTLDREGYPELPPGRSPAAAIANDRGRRRVAGESMDQFAGFLALQLREPVLNGTGLSGKYDFVLSWSYAAMRPDPPPDAGPSIFSAIQEQLGLKLESEKIPVDTLIVDHIDKTPSEN